MIKTKHLLIIISFCLIFSAFAIPGSKENDSYCMIRSAQFQSNQITASVQHRIGVDLKFTGPDVSLSPKIPYTGNNITFTVNMKAVLFGAENVLVIAGIDGVQKDQYFFPKIDADQTIPLSFQWKAESGKHTVFFKIDPNNEIKESSETDNEIHKEFNIVQKTIQRVNVPIIICPDTGTMDVEALELSFNNGPAPDSQEYTVKWRNNGEKCIRNIHWHIIDLISSRELVVYKAYVPNSNGYAKSGETVTQKGIISKSDMAVSICTITQGLIHDLYECSNFRLDLDHDNQMSEINESNNSVEKTIYWKKLN